MKTLVQTNDWWFQINPMMFGRDWFIQFEDGEPEVVIKKYKLTTPVAGVLRVKARLREVNLKHERLKENVEAAKSRYFPPEAKPHSARTYSFELAAPLPTYFHCGFRSEGRVEIPGTDGECMLLAFSLPFDTEDVCRVWSRDQPKQRLSKFVVGATYRGKIPDLVRIELQQEISLQYPKFDLERAQRIYGPQMRLMRKSYRESFG